MWKNSTSLHQKTSLKNQIHHHHWTGILPIKSLNHRAHRMKIKQMPCRIQTVSNEKFRRDECASKKQDQLHISLYILVWLRLIHQHKRAPLGGVRYVRYLFPKSYASEASQPTIRSVLFTLGIYYYLFIESNLSHPWHT